MPGPFSSPSFPSRATKRALALVALVAGLGSGCSECARSQPAPGESLGLGRYTVAGVFPLDVREASAVAWYPDRGTLVVLGDHSDTIFEVDPQGRTRSLVSIEGFRDTEGLTHARGARFFLVEEASNDVVAFEYVPGAHLRRPALASWNVAPEAGNSGLEGVSFDPSSGLLLVTKEEAPQAVYEIALGEAPAARVTPLFDPEPLDVDDLAGISVLATVSRLAGTPAARNLLVLSQESSRLLEIDREGNVIDSLSLRFFSRHAEGVSVDATGRIFVVGESSRQTPGSALLVLEPPLEPIPPEIP